MVIAYMQHNFGIFLSYLKSFIVKSQGVLIGFQNHLFEFSCITQIFILHVLPGYILLRNSNFKRPEEKMLMWL